MITLRAGEYYIGDCCYILGNGDVIDWGDFCGKYHDDSDVPITVLDHDVVAYCTLYGDGCYPSNVGFDFPVDAGLIGCTPKELWIRKGEPFGCLLVKFDKDFTCQKDFLGRRGVLCFGHVVIDTSDEEDEVLW